MAAPVPPESPDDEDLAAYLQASVAVEQEQETTEGEGPSEVKQEEDEWWIGVEGELVDVKVEYEEGEEEEETETAHEYSNDTAPGLEDGTAAKEVDKWKQMGVNKPPSPPRKKTRGKGATMRHNSNRRQNERNVVKMMAQKHGHSQKGRWSSSSWSNAWWSSSSSWWGWRGSSWDDAAWQGGGGSSSSSATALLEKALDKIPNAR